MQKHQNSFVWHLRRKIGMEVHYRVARDFSERAYEALVMEPFFVGVVHDDSDVTLLVW